MTLQTNSSRETQQLAETLAALVLAESPHSQARVLALRGELGAGKTTFTQGFMRALGVRRQVTSPTFVVIKRYPLSGKHTAAHVFQNVYHLDCYRIKTIREFEELGIKEILANPQNIVLIEWPENMTKLLPRKKIVIELRHGHQPHQRHIKIRL